MIGILDYGLAKVADLIIKHVISPALNSGAPLSFVTEIIPDTQEMTEAILKIAPLNISNDPKVDSTSQHLSNFFFVSHVSIVHLGNV